MCARNNVKPMHIYVSTKEGTYRLQATNSKAFVLMKDFKSRPSKDVPKHAGVSEWGKHLHAQAKTVLTQQLAAG